MRKILIILFLLIINILSFEYLKEVIYEKKAYDLKLNHNVFILPKKEIMLNDTDEFRPEDYFDFYSFSDFSYRYYFDEKSLYLEVDENNYVFPYAIREKEVEIVETVVIQEVYIREENEATQPVYSEEENDQNSDYEYEADYFNLTRDHFNYVRGSSVSSIIADIQNYIQTNKRVTIDYSSLNPNDSGEYSVFLITDDNTYTVFVTID